MFIQGLYRKRDLGLSEINGYKILIFTEQQHIGNTLFLCCCCFFSVHCINYPMVGQGAHMMIVKYTLYSNAVLNIKKSIS